MEWVVQNGPTTTSGVSPLTSLVFFKNLIPVKESHK